MSTPTRRAVLFDLDNTLILEDASTYAAVREAARAAAERAGVDAERLATTAIETAERLWKAAPSYAYGEAFGIWWGEALWGGFTGAGVGASAAAGGSNAIKSPGEGGNGAATSGSGTMSIFGAGRGSSICSKTAGGGARNGSGCAGICSATVESSEASELIIVTR